MRRVSSLLLVLLLTLASPAWAAITEVASKRVASGANSSVGSFAAVAYPGGGLTTGDFLIAAGSAWGSTAAPTSVAVTSTCSAALTVDLGAVGAGMTWRTWIAWGVATSTGACSTTVNPAGADGTHSGSYSQCAAIGQHATPASVDGGDTFVAGSGGGAASDGITTATANELIIGVLSHDGGSDTLGVTGSGTEIGENEVNSANQAHSAQFLLATTATAYTLSWSCSAGGPSSGSAQTYSFKEATGGGAAAPPQLLLLGVGQ